MVPQLKRGLYAFTDALVMPLAAAFAVAVGIGFMQSGGLFSFEALKFDPQKVMPDLKKLISVQSLVEMVKGFVKITLAAAVAYARDRAAAAVVDPAVRSQPARAAGGAG